MARKKDLYDDVFKHYVAVFAHSASDLKYVTKVEYSPKYTEWKYGKPALAMPYSQAQDVCYGLAVNGYPAIVLTIPDGYRKLGNYDASLYEEAHDNENH